MADGNDSIASQIPICSKSFRTLSAVLDATAEEKRAHLTTALADQIGRFRVWTQNIGAHHWTGKSSLDYRLRDASHIKIRVIRYLKELNGQLVEGMHLSDYLQHLTSHRYPSNVGFRIVPFALQLKPAFTQIEIYRYSHLFPVVFHSSTHSPLNLYRI